MANETTCNPHPDEVELAGPDEVERCSCDESIALRRQLDAVRTAYRSWRRAALEARAPRGPLDHRMLAVTVAGEAYSGLD